MLEILAITLPIFLLISLMVWLLTHFGLLPV